MWIGYNNENDITDANVGTTCHLSTRFSIKRYGSNKGKNEYAAEACFILAARNYNDRSAAVIIEFFFCLFILFHINNNNNRPFDL